MKNMFNNLKPFKAIFNSKTNEWKSFSVYTNHEIFYDDIGEEDFLKNGWVIISFLGKTLDNVIYILSYEYSYDLHKIIRKYLLKYSRELKNKNVFWIEYSTQKEFKFEI